MQAGNPRYIGETPIVRRGGAGQWGAPIYHWTAHRIVSHVKLCVLALPLERAAEIHARDTRRNIRLALEELTAVRAHPRPPAIVADSPMAVDTRAKRVARKYD